MGQTPVVPAGFRIEPVIEKLHHPTRLVFGPDGRLYVAQQTGEVVAVSLKEGQELSRAQVVDAKTQLLGIALNEEKLWTSDKGAIAVYSRQPDGTYANRQELVTNIPTGLHQNDGFAWGPDGKLYWGLGSTTDRGPEEHPWSGSVMRMNPDGTGVEVYAAGFRNPYGIGFGADGKLWVTDNGSDNPSSQDELNLVEQGAHYGFPGVFGTPPAGSPTKAPIALLGDHNSSDGLVVYTGKSFPEQYRGGIFIAMWGSSDDDNVGRAVGFATADGKVSTLATGLNRPLDVTMGPDGDLWVADFVPGIVWRIWYTGTESQAGANPPPPPAPVQNTPTKPVVGAATPEAATGGSSAASWVVPGAVVAALLVLAILITALRRRRRR